jgi:hypothetical protein
MPHKFVYDDVVGPRAEREYAGQVHRTAHPPKEDS